MAERRIQTSAGMETASETVARAKAQIASATQTKTDPTTAALSSGGRPKSAVLEALTERLLQQGKGISTSSSSQLQNSINEAISGTQQAGNLTNQRLQSEREREVSFAQDRASATFTTAQEGRTGYATQVAAFRELTETTEKSVRDLDKRYQEAMMGNDAETARTIASLKVQKLQFQMQQEQNFFSNTLQLAGMQQQEDQFYKNQLNENARFSVQMAQSDYQFEKNLGIQYKELDLKSQELDISRERNQISWAEYKLRKSELGKEKGETAFSAQIIGDLRNEVKKQGKSPKDLDPTAYAKYAMETYGPYYADLDFEKVLQTAQRAKAEMVTEGTSPFNEYTGSFPIEESSWKDAWSGGGRQLDYNNPVTRMFSGDGTKRMF